MKSRRSIATALTIAVIGVAALSGCGSDGDGDSDSAATTPPATSAAAEQDIVALASATPTLSTLTAAVTAADLATTLQGEGPFTVFAPTDDAFKALPASVVDNLLLPCNKEALVKVLTYHVVPGEVTSADIQPGDVATVEGQDVTLSVDGSTVKVNEATVVTPDVDASNGVVHIIDGVLVPPGVDPAALKTSC